MSKVYFSNNGYFNIVASIAFAVWYRRKRISDQVETEKVRFTLRGIVCIREQHHIVDHYLRKRRFDNGWRPYKINAS